MLITLITEVQRHCVNYILYGIHPVEYNSLKEYDFEAVYTIVSSEKLNVVQTASKSYYFGVNYMCQGKKISQL